MDATGIPLTMQYMWVMRKVFEETVKKKSSIKGIRKLVMFLMLFTHAKKLHPILWGADTCDIAKADEAALQIINSDKYLAIRSFRISTSYY